MIRAVEPFVFTLDPQADSGSLEIVHAGYGFIYSLEGQIQYTIGKAKYLLEPGDSLLFAAKLRHRWRNPGNTVVNALIMLADFSESDRGLSMHQHATEE